MSAAQPTIRKSLKGVHRDPLTNCYTKAQLSPLINELVAESKQTKKPFSLLVIDVDHFKQFNDKYGHISGDEALKYFSSTLHLSFQHEDAIPIRFGGDEFIVLFPAKPSSSAAELASNLKKTMRTRQFLLKGKQHIVTFSGGIATYPDDTNDPSEILHKADQAMYFSKKKGRNRSVQFNQVWFEKIKSAGFIGLLLFFLLIGYVLVHERATLLLKQLYSTKIIIGNKEADHITLKSGGRLSGLITHEDPSQIWIQIEFSDKGSGVITLKKSEIAQIQRHRTSPGP